LRNFINNKIKNVRDFYRRINDFRKGHQPRSTIVMDEKVDLVTYSNIILARWRNHFSHILNKRGAKNVRQTEIHTAEPQGQIRLNWILKR